MIWTDQNRIGINIELPPEAVTEDELSACSYVTALSQEQMDTLFPLTNNNNNEL